MIPRPITRLPPALVAVGVFALAACATPQVDTAHRLTCSGYEKVLRTLAGFRTAGDLSPAQVNRVNELRPILNDLCSGPSRDSAAALEAIERHVRELVTIRNEAAQ